MNIQELQRSNSLFDCLKYMHFMSESETSYFKATADKNGNIDFGKAANIGQNDGNPGNFVNFQKNQSWQ